MNRNPWFGFTRVAAGCREKEFFSQSELGIHSPPRLQNFAVRLRSAAMRTLGFLLERFNLPGEPVPNVKIPSRDHPPHVDAESDPAVEIGLKKLETIRFVRHRVTAPFPRRWARSGRPSLN